MRASSTPWLTATCGEVPRYSIRTNTQRIAHVGRKRARIVEHTVEGVVQATAATRDTQRETARKGGIARVERSGCAGVGGELASIAPRLAGGDQNA